MGAGGQRGRTKAHQRCSSTQQSLLTDLGVCEHSKVCTVAHKQQFLVGKLVGESDDVVLAATQKLQRTKMKGNHKAASSSWGREHPTVAGSWLSARFMAVSGKDADPASWWLPSSSAVVLDISTQFISNLQSKSPHYLVRENLYACYENIALVVIAMTFSHKDGLLSA